MLSNQVNLGNEDNDKVEREERVPSSPKNTFGKVVTFIVAALLLALYTIPTIYSFLPPSSLYRVSVIYLIIVGH